MHNEERQQVRVRVHACSDCHEVHLFLVYEVEGKEEPIIDHLADLDPSGCELLGSALIDAAAQLRGLTPTINMTRQ